MKVFSIAFQSTNEPNRIAMHTVVSESSELAYARAFESVKEKQGDLDWHPIITNVIEIEGEKLNVQPPIKNIDKILDRNWTYKTIIDNKDETLFAAMKPYLDENITKLIIDKTGFSNNPGFSI